MTTYNFRVMILTCGFSKQDSFLSQDILRGKMNNDRPWNDKTGDNCAKIDTMLSLLIS